MSSKLGKLSVMLIIIAILLNLTLSNMKIVHSTATNGRIDLFTQKEPYSGKGSNMPSDAFCPEEIVILYALVTYNEIPVQNLPVAFNVKIPTNVSFGLTARTNSSGIATVNFTILTPPINIEEREVFGEWLVLANVLIGGSVFQDALAFKVDWIVKLISVRTIDGNLTYRTEFGKGGYIGLEITLRSIAISMKSAALAIVIQDELEVPVNFSTIPDFDVQPNEKLIFLYCKLLIPKWAYVGKATVFVSALTTPVNQSGIAYCPAISTNFFIRPYGPLEIAFRDAAVVNVAPSATSVELGQPLSISVLVRNEGTEVESFNVSAYCGDVLIGTLGVTALSPYSKAILNFTLDTSLFDVRSYVITVSIPYLANETDLTDNIFVDGVVKIKPKLPTTIHDIAIVNIAISKNSLYIGELLQINVTVFNKGTETETFDVGAYYDFSLIETSRVNNLASKTQVTLIFIWNTSSVNVGFYQMRASAPLPDDINVLDNTFVGGLVEVKARPTQPTPSHLLSIITSPISSVNFTISGASAKTPYSVTHVEGAYTIVFPSEWMDPTTEKLYTFSHWEDNSTNRTRIIFLDKNMNLTAYYEEAVKGWFVPEWFYWLLLPLLILIIIVLILWLYRRKRRKKAEEAFYSGWTAWYYCYDLKNRTSKNQKTEFNKVCYGL